MMTLSVNMMVRNEEATLGRCLESVAPLVDAVYVIDTGSTDSTIDIAWQYATTVTERPWPDDFAKARNWTLEQGSEDFILIMDADEYFPPLPADALRSLLHDDVAAIDFTVLNVIDEGKLQDRLVQPRILRRDERIRYKGIVHHQIAGSLQHYMSETGHRWVRHPEIVLHHTGYDLSVEERTQKYLARLPLYRKAKHQAVTAADKTYYHYQYAVGLFMAGMFRSTIDQLDDFDGRLLARDQYRHALSLLVKSYSILLDRGERVDLSRASRAAKRLAQHAARDSEALAFAGQLAFMTGQNVPGMALILRAYQVARDGERDGWQRHLAPSVVLEMITNVFASSGHHDAAQAINEASEDERRRTIDALYDQLIDHLRRQAA